MIRLMLGSVGSGKTACCVRELMLNPTHKVTYSNIKTKKIKNNNLINNEMIIKKELQHEKKTGEKIYSYKLNQDFWKKTIKKEKSINIIIDEAHTIYDARKAMSKLNRVMNDFLALLRRILGSSDSGYGQLTLITQLERRIDPIAREMATNVHYHKCHFLKTCKDCGKYWKENNETAEPMFKCYNCQSHNLLKHKHIIEVWHFRNIDLFVKWRYFGRKRLFHKHYFVTDIEKYFPLYDTLQWDNLISDI